MSLSINLSIPCCLGTRCISEHVNDVLSETHLIVGSARLNVLVPTFRSALKQSVSQILLIVGPIHTLIPMPMFLYTNDQNAPRADAPPAQMECQ